MRERIHKDMQTVSTVLVYCSEAANMKTNEQEHNRKIINANSYNEYHGNSLIQLAKTIRHVMTIHMTDPRARNPFNAAATLPDLSQSK